MVPKGRGRAVILVVCGAALAVGAITFLRARGSDTAADAEFEAHLRAHRQTIAAAAMVPIDGQESLERVLARAPAGGSVRLSEQQASLLVRAAADFLAVRVSDPSLDEYEGWRRSRGYRPRALEELREVFPDLDEVQAKYADADVPDGSEWDAAWRAYWRRGQRVSGASAVPARVADSPQMMGLAAGWLSTVGGMWPALPDLPGDPLVFYDGLFTSHPWWVGPVTLEDEIRRRGRALVAVVGCVVEFGDGARRPVVLSWLWDPQRSSWWIVSVSYGGTRPVAFVY